MSVPTYGAIILDPSMEFVSILLLVHVQLVYPLFDFCYVFSVCLCKVIGLNQVGVFLKER